MLSSVHSIPGKNPPRYEPQLNFAIVRQFGRPSQQARETDFGVKMKRSLSLTEFLTQKHRGEKIMIAQVRNNGSVSQQSVAVGRA